MNNKNFTFDTELLYKGDKVKGCDLVPESAPLFMASAFDIAGDLDDVNSTYENKGYTYIRTRNPNRHMLADKISYLENGEESAIFSSGMGAIQTVLFSLLKSGDHIIAGDTLYGESIELVEIMAEYGIEYTFVDFSDAEAVKKAIKPNTKVIYGETASNPCVALADIESLAEIAHSCGAKLVVDNTFVTAYALKCLDLGADVVINSLTKFINGHSDALLGSATGSKEIMDKILTRQSIFGTAGGTFSTWLVQRSMLTVGLRVKKQMDNADKLARALEKDPHVIKVNYPTVEKYPQKELAKKLFKNSNMCGAMLSFEMPSDREKINEFMKRLNICHYAPTLGGVRTTMSHPATSSHRDLPEEMKKALGITEGLMRISVGIEEPEDLIADFTQALKAFD